MVSTEPTAVDWRGLTAAEPEALAAASAEVELYVRALAAYGVIVDRDSVPSELEDRQTTIRTKLWPSDPLEGYGLHASLGAFLVTKVAVDLVPTGHLGLRPEHLSPQGVQQALIDHGVTPEVAASLVGDWPGEPEGFTGESSGLSLSELAGLAARTLTREERRTALAQVAASPRDLARLAATAGLLNAVRTVLPLLPIPSLGGAYDLAVVGLAVGRGDRVATLLNPPEDVFHAALVELGTAGANLAAGEPYTVPLDVQVSAPAAFGADLWDENEDEEDVTIVEAGPVIAPCLWREGTAELSDLETWQQEMKQWSATRGTLGLRIPASAPTVATVPIPPEAGLVRRAINPLYDSAGPDRHELEAPLYAWRSDPLDALAPVVRAAVRMVAQAAEGQSPLPGTLERAGDLRWLVRRASALAAVVRGDLEGALEATHAMPPGAAPERRWAQDRARRFVNRTADPVEPNEARPMGAALIGDLAHLMARTITGTVPLETSE